VGPSSRLVLLLGKFRANHEIQTLEAGGDRWEYLVGGAGDTTVVILPGGGATAEMMFEIVAALESRFRVVSLGYPATVVTAEPLIQGIHAIFDALGIQRAFLLGHSLGGLAAQAFALRHPELVEGMVLASTGFYHGARAWALPTFVRAMAHAPESLLTRFTAAQLRRITKNADAHEFWMEYFTEKMAEPEQAARQKAQSACLVDLARFFRRNPIGRNLDWVQSMPVLVITSDDDRGFTPAERKHLQGLYPKSELHAFPKGVGHGSFIVRPDEYAEAVTRFVGRVAAERVDPGRPVE